MSKNKSMSYQVKTTLGRVCCFGRSKHEDKRPGNRFHPYGIYSVRTYDTYVKQCTAFAEYCKSEHGCRTVAACEPYIREYLDHYSVGKSPSSVHTAVYAIQKLYDATQHGYKVEYEHEKRERAVITKNRGRIEDVKDFDEKRHADLIEFGRATGLRRHELLNLRAGDLNYAAGTVAVVSGKGGRYREAAVLKSLPAGNKFVLRAQQLDPEAKVFARSDIPSRMPEHRCRRAYAQEMYRQLARPTGQIPAADRYVCRKDKNGIVYDRAAMRVVSQNLGHSRIDVIAVNYL